MSILMTEIPLRTKVKLTVTLAAAASAVGSNILLAVLSLCISIWTDTAASALLKRDIPLIGTCATGLVCHLAFIYIWSIFRRPELYMPWLTAIPVLLLAAAYLYLFTRGGKDRRSVIAALISAGASIGLYLLMFIVDMRLMLR